MKCSMCGRIVTQEEADLASAIIDPQGEKGYSRLCHACAEALLVSEKESEAEIANAQTN